MGKCLRISVLFDMKILILCTGNSGRSQMAEAFLRSCARNNPTKHFEIQSAGTKPAREVHPLALRVMKEIGIDMGSHYPKGVDRFLSSSFDYVITVCDNAKSTCPAFTGEVGKRLHIGFEDPAAAPAADQLAVFRRVRDGIREVFSALYTQIVE
jgi:arsenate reductase (thioredoxin)